MKKLFLGASAVILFGNSAASFANYEPMYEGCESGQYQYCEPAQYQYCEPTKGFLDPFKFGSTEISLYGFVKFETLWVNRLTGSFPEILQQNVPLNKDKADRHSQTILDARSSRLGVKIIDEICGVKMKGVIEGDFFNTLGDALVFNSRYFRIRLAYAKAETPSGFFLLAGQFWTLPCHIPDIEAPWYVNTQIAPVGVAFARQPQLRLGYKREIDNCGEFKLEASIEKHAFNNLGFIPPSDSEPVQGCQMPWPLFAGKVSWLGDQFKCSLDGAISQARFILNSEGDKRKKNVWAVSAIAKYKISRLTLWGTINHNVGLASMFEGYFNNMALSRTNHLLAFRSSGGCAAVRWDWIDDVLFSDVLWSIQQGHEREFTAFSGDTIRRFRELRVNLFYRFWETWQTGIEYQSVYVKSFNGNKGNANAVHLAIWYNFGQP